jgi:putative hydrolase of the HAD superfamily
VSSTGGPVPNETRPGVVRAVLFDLDDTLVDTDRAARRAFLEVLGADTNYELWLQESDQHFWPYSRGEVTYEQMRVGRMAHFLHLSDHRAGPNEAARLEAARFVAANWFELFSDVRATFELLRGRGVSVGLITNGDSGHQREKVRLAQLENDFDVVIVSGEVGATKPDPAIFRLACERLGVEPAEAVYIGDRLEVDAIGAARAGMVGVWIDRRGIATGGEKVHVISHIADVATLIDKLALVG